jgi:hypothetical protein
MAAAVLGPRKTEAPNMIAKKAKTQADIFLRSKDLLFMMILWLRTGYGRFGFKGS